MNFELFRFMFFCTRPSSSSSSSLLLDVNPDESLSSYLVRVRIYPRPSSQSTMMSKIKQETYNNVTCPLFITIADSFYLPAVRNFVYALQKYHLEKNFINLCLDSLCVKRGRSKGLFVWSSFINGSIAKTKVR